MLLVVGPDAWCTELGRVRGAGIRVIGTATGPVSASAMTRFASDAARLGYVAVDTREGATALRRRSLSLRHVVLVVSDGLSDRARRWIRELAAASPRAHAIVTVPTSPECPSPVGALRPIPKMEPCGLAWRAARLCQRGRLASAQRWLCAASEHANRRGDELGVAAAFRVLVRVADARDEEKAQALVRRGLRLLAGLSDLAARSHLVAALADVWLTQGELERAEAALAAVEAECVLSAVEVPAWIRGPQAEVACWQGRWDEAASRARAARHCGWVMVAALAQRQWQVLSGELAALVESSDVESGWARVCSLMAVAASGDLCGLRRALSRIGPPEAAHRWTDVLVLESLRMADAAAEAEAWVGARERHPRGRAEWVLWRWATRGPGAGPSGLESEIARLGADGIRRWGTGRVDMQVWTGVAALLQQIQEAADAPSALRRGCRWALEYTGVDGVAIVGVDGGLLVCEPDGTFRRTPGAGHVEHVRYGGVRIGDVVMWGAARDESETRAIGAALATACAPAVRARLDELLVLRAGESLAGELLGGSQVMSALREAVARAAASSYPVLIEGESGTGKELVARALHRLSPRRDRRWAAVNCAALTDELLEAELFGHTRGAFTGAMGSRVGLLEDAHEGTVFLDEVGELSPRAQAKLLRVLQEGEIRPVGENRSRRVDVRLIAATNRHLADSAQRGEYREDLIFRLAVIRLRVAPLRDRIEDVPILAHAFWKTAAAQADTRAVLAPDAIAALCRAAWPGNVRELQNVVATLAVGGPTRGRIGARHVQKVLEDRGGRGSASTLQSLSAARAESDRRLVAASLARHANSRAAAARELGVSRQGLAKLMARMSLPCQTQSGAPPPRVVASKGRFR